MPGVADFDDLVRTLLGDLVDTEAIAKMSPDPSSVHTPGQLKPVRLKRRVAKRGEQDLEAEPSPLKRNIALATNAGGVLAAPGAIYAANQARKAKEGGVPRAAMKSPAGRKVGLHRVASAIERNPKAVAAAGIAGVGLQLMNAGGDYIAAGEMNRQRKVANLRAQRAAEVHKSINLNMLKSGRMASLGRNLGFGGRHAQGAAPVSRMGAQSQHSANVPQFNLMPGGAQRSFSQAPAAAASPGAQNVLPGKHRATGPRQGLLRRRTPVAPPPAPAAKAPSTGMSTGTKAALGGGALVGAYGLGSRNGREQAYYGKRDDVEIAGEFSKFDNDKKRAYGWASVVTMNGEPVVDRQGDYIGLDDIEEAAYTYVRKSRVAGDMHRRTTGLDGADAPHKAGELIESVVFTPDKCHAMGLPASFAGRWWMGVQVEDDDVWAEVKKGNRTGFSIHGKGLRKDTTLDEIRSS